MKSRIILASALLLLMVSPGACGAGTEAHEDTPAQAGKITWDDHPAPAATYRKGHVQPVKIKSYVKKSKTGYIIDLPGAYPIATPTVYKGKLYASGGFGSRQFYCFDAQTGQTIWSINLDDDGPSSCVIADDIVVFNTESCTLFACRADTGKMLWSWWLGDPLTSAPAIAENRVYTTYPANGQGQGALSWKDGDVAASHILGCFDLHTGKILWQKWIDGDAVSAPVIVDRQVFITTFAGTLYTFNALDGNIKSAVRARATSAPTITGEDIYYTKRTDRSRQEVKEAIAAGKKNRMENLPTYYEKKADYLDQRVQEKTSFAARSKTLDAGNGFAAAPKASGYEKAAANVGQGSVSSMQSFQGSRILSYKMKNYNTMGDELICTEPKSGQVVWKNKIKGDLKTHGGFLATPPVAVDNHIIVATLNGDIAQYEAGTGRLEKRYDLKSKIRFQPVVDNGRIFVGTQDGKVICINTHNPGLTGWPMWGRDAAHTGVVQ